MAPRFQRLIFLLAALTAGAVSADAPADLAVLTRDVQALLGNGSSGGVLSLGRCAFPLALGTNGLCAPAAAAYYRDDVRGGRCVFLAHTSFYVDSNPGQSPFLGNVLRWLGHADKPVVRCGPGASPLPAQAAGFDARSTGGPALADDLLTANVLVLNLHSDLADDEWELIRQYAARGGGLLLIATPWSLDEETHIDAARVLSDYGLALGKTGPEGRVFPVVRAYQPLCSGVNAVLALIQARQAGAPLAAADQQRAAFTLDQLVSAGEDRGMFQRALDQLGKSYGWIALSATNPLVKAEHPLEAMLTRYQAKQLDTLPADEVPEHPSAHDWPGLCAPGDAVKQTLTIRAVAPPPRLMNHGEAGVTRNTGLYARPGQPITVTLPDQALADGLAVRIGIHTDENFHLDAWRRFPQVTRRTVLSNRVTRLACAFGGLVQILVPPGCSRGPVDVTIEGAVPAPAYRYGVDKAEAWPKLRAQPGAWGYVETSNFCVYASRRQLMTIENPDAVGAHWNRVITLCDQMLGYARARQRGESAMTDIQISVGYGHAGYPVVMEYGDSDKLVRGILSDGDWGFYHELGHTYQDSFDGQFAIATSAEVDVNLAPALLMSLLHHRSPWDGDVHDTYDAASRLKARDAFFARPPEQRTWDQACRSPVGYDFYLGLAEGFGWELYGRAFARLLRFLQDPQLEPALAALEASDPNYRRNRLFLLLCQESGRNLGPYAERYGLGRAPFGLSDAVRRQMKNLPVWTGNQPPTSLSMPDTLTVEENAAPGTLLYTFKAQDPDSGNLFDFRLVRGNEDGAFALDPRSGELRVVDLDFERAPDYLLAVEVTDVAVPRFGVTNYFEVVVKNLDEAPAVEAQIFEASTKMGPGTSLGRLTVATESDRALDALELVNPQPADVFTLEPETRRLQLADHTRLPTSGVLTLTVSARDVSGRQGNGTIYVLANERCGMHMERWNGHDLAAPPAVVGQVDDPSLQASAGNDFTRRLSGWLVPPRSGSYTFWTSGDETVELFMSPDDQPARKQRIAFNRSATKRQGWEERPTQRSAPVQLRAGHFYYLEVLHTETEGEDHVAIAWEGPGFTRELLPGRVLLPRR